MVKVTLLFNSCGQRHRRLKNTKFSLKLKPYILSVQLMCSVHESSITSLYIKIKRVCLTKHKYSHLDREDSHTILSINCAFQGLC